MLWNLFYIKSRTYTFQTVQGQTRLSPCPFLVTLWLVKVLGSAQEEKMGWRHLTLTMKGIREEGRKLYLRRSLGNVLRLRAKRRIFQIEVLDVKPCHSVLHPRDCPAHLEKNLHFLVWRSRICTPPTLTSGHVDEASLGDSPSCFWFSTTGSHVLEICMHC